MGPWSPVTSATPQIYNYRKISNIRRNLVGYKNCWSLRCSWSIACRRCSNYIFILDLTSGFKGFSKDSRKTVRESFKCWDLLRLNIRDLTVFHGNPVQMCSFQLRGDDFISGPDVDQHLITAPWVSSHQWVNSLTPGSFEWYFGEVIFKLISVTMAEVSLVKLSSAECHWALLMISQHWFR